MKASTGIFLGGDDHVTVGVHNLGRDITDLAIGMGLRDSWLGGHGIAMGTSRSCEIDQQLGGFDCGPVRAGESVSFQLRALPNAVGSFSYAAAFFDRSTGGLQQIKGGDGGDLVVAWTETVTPIPQH